MEKTVNIRLNKNKPSPQISRMISRALTSKVRRSESVNKNGNKHIIFTGNPNNIRYVLGTNEPEMNEPNEAFMIQSRKTAIPITNYIRFTPKKSVTASLYRNTLRKLHIKKKNN